VRLDWKAVVGILISGVLLWWIFRGEDLGAIWVEVQGANWGILLAAVAVATAGFMIRAMRWGILLRPLREHVPLRSRFAATCIGFSTNNLLPARLGEFARAYAMSRMAPIPASGVFGSLVVERFLDGVAILGLLVVAVLWPTFPSDATVAGQPIALAMRGVVLLLAGLLAVLVALVLFPDPVIRVVDRVARALLPDSVARLMVDTLRAFLDGLTVLQDPRLLIPALAWSFGFWAWHSISFWLGFRAFGIELDYAAALFVNAVIAVGVAVPSAPGFIGTFHAAAKIGLTEVYGVADGPTLAFAFGYHLGGFIPVTLIGLYYAWRLGLSLGEVGESEGQIAHEMEAEHGGGIATEAGPDGGGGSESPPGPPPMGG
jgi:uncharacterized protein (TIRG00374 family)